jgi:hypothetical protein
MAVLIYVDISKVKDFRLLRLTSLPPTTIGTCKGVFLWKLSKAAVSCSRCADPLA